jgi:hypothetical protein
MRVVVLAAFLFSFCQSATAGVPHDLWGYFPGQTLEQAQSVDPGRGVRDCSFKGVWKCIAWTQEYLGSNAEIFVQFDYDKKVTQVAFRMLSFKGDKEYRDCRPIADAAVTEARRIYGDVTEATRGRAYVWDDGTFRYELMDVCFPLPSGEPTGGVVGWLKRASAQ